MMLSHWVSGSEVSDTPQSFRTPATTNPAAQLDIPDYMNLKNAPCRTH